MHDDIGIDRLAEMIVGRDDRTVRQLQRPHAETIEIAIDLKIRKLPFQVQREPVRQRTLAEIVLEQERLARVKLLQCGDDLVQLGVHLAPAEYTSSFRERSEAESRHSRKMRLLIVACAPSQ